MNLSMVPPLATMTSEATSRYRDNSGTTRSPMRSDSPVKPATSMNITVNSWIEPPGFASTPWRSSERTRSAGMNLPKADRPAAISAIAPERLGYLGQPRRMTAHLVQRKAFDMPDFPDDAGERGGDHRARQHRRQQGRQQRADGETDDQSAQRGFDRPEELGFGNDGRERPAGKRQRRERDFIGLALRCQPAAPRFLSVLVAGRRLRQRHARQRQHALPGCARDAVRRPPCLAPRSTRRCRRR